jgi:hypothetical protein
MELHAPESPIHSFKDFAIHIAVVTCGILIALGLEGVREAVHNHALVRETRENVRFEMNINRNHSTDEVRRVSLYSAQLKLLIADLPTLAQQHPEQINTRLAEIDNPEYFFIANSWQSALSTGSLEHMSTEEVNIYGGAAESIKVYTELQKNAVAEEARSKAFFTAHPRLNSDQLAEGTEHLLLFYNAERKLANVGPQMQGQVELALKAAIH